MKAASQTWLGTILLTASAVAYSSAGFFTRLIPVDAWTLLFWRGLFAGSFLFAMVVLQERGRPPGGGLLGRRHHVLPERHASHQHRRCHGGRCGHSVHHGRRGVAADR